MKRTYWFHRRGYGLDCELSVPRDAAILPRSEARLIADICGYYFVEVVTGL